MIEPKFLSVSELAARWGATERQILEHGAHLRIPIFFLFDGLAFTQADRWLMGHGAHDKEQELKNKKELAAKWDDHIKRNARGLTDIYTRLDNQQVIDLRKKIADYEDRIEALTELLDNRAKGRRTKSAFGYLRLPPRTVVDIQEQATIPFPHLAFNQAGELLTLEPGVTGKWKDTLSVGDLLIPLADIKSLESHKKSEDSPEDQKHLPKARLQELAILKEIRALGYDPSALPPFTRGKPWVKKEVWNILEKRTDLFVSRKTFDVAWSRLNLSAN